jgi:hypothetical protein
MKKQYMVILEVYRKPGQKPSRFIQHVMAQSESEARRLAIKEAEDRGYKVRSQLDCSQI